MHTATAVQRVLGCPPAWLHRCPWSLRSPRSQQTSCRGGQGQQYHDAATWVHPWVQGATGCSRTSPRSTHLAWPHSCSFLLLRKDIGATWCLMLREGLARRSTVERVVERQIARDSIFAMISKQTRKIEPETLCCSLFRYATRCRGVESLMRSYVVSTRGSHGNTRQQYQHAPYPERLPSIFRETPIHFQRDSINIGCHKLPVHMQQRWLGPPPELNSTLAEMLNNLSIRLLTT
jgi:hypothetical protein